MTDMLVKLYELPGCISLLQQHRDAGVDIRRALAPEKYIVTDWIGEVFSSPWVSECEVAFAHEPVSCFVAVENEKPIGFVCYDTTARGFIGPIGVDERARGRGIGKALLLAGLHAMEAQGYAYAIIGGGGGASADFYAKTAGAVVIEGSSPGVYRGRLKRRSEK